MIHSFLGSGRSHWKILVWVVLGEIRRLIGALFFYLVYADDMNQDDMKTRKPLQSCKQQEFE